MGGCGTIRLWDPMIRWRESISGITRLTKTGAVSRVQFMGRNSHAKKWILINCFFLSSSCFSSFFLTLPSLNSTLFIYLFLLFYIPYTLFLFCPALRPWVSEFSHPGVKDFSQLAIDLSRKQLVVGAR